MAGVLKALPFLFEGSEELVSWRAETFWEKEPETLEWLQFYADKKIEKLSFLDVGANIGFYSLFAASLNAFDQIIAIEPMEVNCERLLRNISLNKFQTIKVVSGALGAYETEGYFLSSDSRIASSGGQLLASAIVEENLRNLTKVKIFSGSSLLKSGHEKTIVKIDVDGSEYDVLVGLGHAFEMEKIVSVLVETNEQEERLIDGLLSKYGFKESLFFKNLKKHSTVRRKSSGSNLRNIIYER